MLEHNAIMIQAVWRGKMARKWFRNAKESLAKEKAAREAKRMAEEEEDKHSSVIFKSSSRDSINSDKSTEDLDKLLEDIEMEDDFSQTDSRPSSIVESDSSVTIIDDTPISVPIEKETKQEEKKEEQIQPTKATTTSTAPLRKWKVAMKENFRSTDEIYRYYVNLDKK